MMVSLPSTEPRTATSATPPGMSAPRAHRKAGVHACHVGAFPDTAALDDCTPESARLLGAAEVAAGRRTAPTDWDARTDGRMAGEGPACHGAGLPRIMGQH